MNNGPTLWKRILDDIDTGDGPKMIAGGAIRDYMLGIIPKDIDVFCINPNGDWAFVGDQGFHNWRFDLQTAALWDQDGLRTREYQGDANIAVVTQYTAYGHNVQIICLRNTTLAEKLDSFDIAACQGAFTDTGMHLSSAALSDLDNRVLTPINPGYHTQDRLARIINHINTQLTEGPHFVINA